MNEPHTITFASRDGLTITADHYPVPEPKHTMLLCHRSHFNRGEYRQIAPVLQQQGYECLAIDQRSGMSVYNTINETSKRAKAANLPTGYGDARPDIEAAVDYLYGRTGQPIILFGSSYSAALALLVAVDNPKVKAVVAFSPGEYLKKHNVAAEITELSVPTFVTGAKKEMRAIEELMERVRHEHVTYYKPVVESVHGAKALWPDSDGNKDCWKSLLIFLSHVERSRST